MGKSMDRETTRARAANDLRWHFGTEASDAGARSPSLERIGSGGGQAPDAPMAARLDRNREAQPRHKRIREALRRLPVKHARMLELAYGSTMRSRDSDDGGKYKAPKQVDRNWRVRLTELYRSPECAIVLGSAKARALYEAHIQALEDNVTGTNSPTRGDVEALQAGVDRGLIGWLLHEGRPRASAIWSYAQAALNLALDAFAAECPPAPTENVPRARSGAKTRDRFLAGHADHGAEIG